LSLHLLARRSRQKNKADEHASASARGSRLFVVIEEEEEEEEKARPRRAVVV
jgi:hypothetical protein